MTFITAILWIIPIILILSILVYGHVVVISIGMKILWVVKNCFSKKSKASCMEEMKQIFTEDLFLTQQKYKNRSFLSMGFGLFFVVHLLIFLVSYFTYVNDDTKYHKAKAYYAVGAIPHIYSVVLGHIKTPLYPALLGFNLPITKIKEILFEKGVEYIPKDDAERELWEYDWFYYPYVLNLYSMWGEYVPLDVFGGDFYAKEKDYNYFKIRLENLFKIMEALQTKNIADDSLNFRYQLRFGYMARYYFMNEKYLAPYNEVDERGISKFPNFLKTDKKLLYRRNMIEKWLFDTKQSLENMEGFEIYLNENLKSRLFAKSMLDSTLLLYLQANMMSDIYTNDFSCQSERVLKYIDLKKEFLDSSALTKLKKLGYISKWYSTYSSTIRIMQSEFFRQLLNKECHIDLPGHSRDISSFVPYLMDVNRSVYKDSLEILEKNRVKKKLIKKKYPNREVVVIDGLEYQNIDLIKGNWFESKKYCKDLDLYGKGWRLPNLAELEKIANVDFKRKRVYEPANWYEKNKNKAVLYDGGLYFLKEEFLNSISTSELRNKTLAIFWTSEEMWVPSLNHYAFQLNFWNGTVMMWDKNNERLVLCVRPIQENIEEKID